MLGPRERGYLRAGYHADVVVIDPERFAPRADYVRPRRLSAGVEHALINGTRAIAAGRLTGAASARALRHRPPAVACPIEPEPGAPEP
ncbi:hypothetical protein H0E84_12735 [Luteimonas sp. SJ-92]|uniref:Amidohydrolase 3 domain-containing protein n=1 Tax=Luteimonas salinisoli TaxID=2752307 RepID=A0A853JF65_9GAMM|nr:hypothetical protein [Luteimonas salinisoli]NZA27249.1 hypothetical protein [Luteimonas salinisoli]